jgi:hypothetical protein
MPDDQSEFEKMKRLFAECGITFKEKQTPAEWLIDIQSATFYFKPDGSFDHSSDNDGYTYPRHGAWQ